MRKYFLGIYYAILGKNIFSNTKYSQSYTEWLIVALNNADNKKCELQTQLDDLKQVNIKLIQEINHLGSRKSQVYRHGYISVLSKKDGVASGLKSSKNKK